MPLRAFAIVKEQKELIERTVSEPSLSQQHLISVLRKLQAGTSPLLITYGEGDYHANDDEGAGEYKADDDDDDTDQGAALVTVAPPPTNSLSPEALRIMQQLETSATRSSPLHCKARVQPSRVHRNPRNNRRMRPHQSDAFRRSIAGRLKLPTARRGQGKAFTPTRRSLRRCQNHPRPNRRDISRASRR